MGDLNLNIRLRGQDAGIGRLVNRVRQSFRNLERDDAARHQRVMRRLDGVVAGYRRIGSAARGAVVAGAAAAGAIFGAGIIGIARTTAEFEKYEAVLIGLEGSQANAQKSMNWVKEFAKTTPYEIGQVMEAFVRLRVYGIDPTDGTMRVLGDTASTMGKNVMDAVEMLADAQSGEFERLKEFGIRARQEGNRVTFSWVENGKTIERSTAKTGAEITKTLLGIFGPKNAGAMERQSKTLGGIWSSLMDEITFFKKDVADAGLGAFMREEMSALLAGLKTPEGQVNAKALAKEISGALIDGIRTLRGALKGVDVTQLIGGLVTMITFIPKVIEFFGGLEGVFTALGSAAILKIGIDIGILGATIAGIAGIAAGPIVAVIALITAIALGVFAIYRNWDKIGPYFSGVWTGLKGLFKRGVDGLWGILPGWFRAVLTGARFVLNLASGGLPGRPPSEPRPPRPPSQSLARVDRPATGQSRPATTDRLQVDVRTYADGRPPQSTVSSSSPRISTPRGPVRPRS